MCAPCKIIINEESGDSARRGSLLRELTLNPPPDLSGTDAGADDFLFELAKYEVEYIKATRRAAVKFAKRHGASERWVKLLEELV